MYKLISLVNAKSFHIEIPPLNFYDLHSFFKSLFYFKEDVSHLCIHCSDPKNMLSDRVFMIDNLKEILDDVGFDGKLQLCITVCASNHSNQSIGLVVDELSKRGVSSFLFLKGARPVERYSFETGMEFISELYFNNRIKHNVVIHVPLYLDSNAINEGLSFSLAKALQVKKNHGIYCYETVQLFHPIHYERLYHFRKFDTELVVGGVFIFGSLAEKVRYEDQFRLDFSFSCTESTFEEEQSNFIQTALHNAASQKNVELVFKCVSKDGLDNLLRFMSV